MRIVAVGTSYSLVVHLALKERTVFIVLFENLPVSIIDTLLQKTWNISVKEWLARHIVACNWATTGMTRGANFDFIVRADLPVPVHRDIGGLHEPPAASRGMQIDRQADAVKFRFPLASRVRLCPLHVFRAGSVARFTRDIDFRPGGCIPIRRQIVVLAQIR